MNDSNTCRVPSRIKDQLLNKFRINTFWMNLEEIEEVNQEKNVLELQKR